MAWQTESKSITNIVIGCQAGNRDAQERLYDEFNRRVFRLTVRMVGLQEAPDVLQQVFLQTFRNVQQYAGRANFATWLYRLTVNECLQFLRRERRMGREPFATEPVDSSVSHTMRAQQQEFLERALQATDPELRAIFLLREVDGLAYSEIAQVLEIPEGTVGSRLNRARQHLREQLLQLGWEL